jgi:ArsR family transcriptional regulator, arsenate/arsenite/antimonite-responsive transcriptional repressor / arsenate reductase (thioredoxin)
MFVDLYGSLEARALTHAALADPGRLRIVDLLSRGDLSPSELQNELGIASNLLAHHLRVLEQASVIFRHRSEGDRRRSYVTLRPGVFDGLLTGAALRARRVVFVCTANSARSQLAAALWARASAVPSTSAGTHPADRIAEGAFEVAAAHGLELPDTPPRVLEALVDGDFVVTVCDSAREELGATGSAHWSVADPVRRGDRDSFVSAYAELERRVADLAPRLVAA